MIFAQPEMDKVLIGLILRCLTKLPYTSPLVLLSNSDAAQFILHSSLVQTRKFDRTRGIKQALKYNFIDSTIALNLAFFVNAAILFWLQPHFIK
jgi:manganese transport protein